MQTKLRITTSHHSLFIRTCVSFQHLASCHLNYCQESAHAIAGTVRCYTLHYWYCSSYARDILKHPPLWLCLSTRRVPATPPPLPPSLSDSERTPPALALS